MPYYLKKRIIDWVIHMFMFGLLAVTLLPIGWMIYSSLKENTDILIGKIPLSNARNNVYEIMLDGPDLWVLTSDGGINKWEKKSLKEEDHTTAQTMTTHFLLDKKNVWVSSANKHLQRFDKNDLKKSKQFKLPLPDFDKAKVVNTTIVSGWGKIYFTMGYKGFEELLEFDPIEEKVTRRFSLKNKLSPTQVRSLLPFKDKMLVGLDKGLLKLDLKSGKVEAVYNLVQYLPIGISRLRAINGKIVISGNTGAFLFDTAKGEVTKTLYTGNVLGLRVHGDKVYVGTNRGFKLYDLKTGKMEDHAQLFRQVRVDGTVIKDSEYAPAEVATLAFSGERLYLGSTYGRVSIYNVKDKRVVGEGAARMGHLVISWVNYIDMWRNVDFGLYLRNSFFICGLAMVFAMVFATLAAYALSRFDFPGSKSFSMIILATQMVPGIMFLIPTYSNFVKLTEMTGFPIKGTYYGIVFVYSAFFVPFSIWILRGFFAAIPVELEEAARIDGCSPLQVFWHVALPLAIPGIIATGIYVFLQAWDELVFAWVLTSADTMTIPVGIRNFVGNYQNRFDLIMAAATVATIPVMILFFMLQKYIVKGLTAGAVKG
ncbi:MAG: carbohydrate ABC transporter permease [Candidatus Margulisiibacteriota bacterium]